MKEIFNKKDLGRILRSVIIIEGKVGEFRFIQKNFESKDLGIKKEAMEKNTESFGVKTPDEFVKFIKSLY